jgi:hypothetical protein
MRFAVPQFIDVEDKLFGPLTLRQAIYLSGGIGTMVVLFTWLGILVGILIGVPMALLAFALAFVKINERPFAYVVYAAVFYVVRNKLYLWRRTTSTTTMGAAPQNDAKAARSLVTPQLSQSRLKELAWSLDTNDSLYTNTNQWK